MLFHFVAIRPVRKPAIIPGKPNTLSPIRENIPETPILIFISLPWFLSLTASESSTFASLTAS